MIPSELNRVSVVVLGSMGHAIAQDYSQSGFEVETCNR